MFGLFRKPKPIPKYKRVWNEARAAVAIVAATLTFLSSAFAYIQIDTSTFEKTTRVISVSANNSLYTKINTQVELPEMTYVIISIDGNQVDHNVYPEGLPRGEILIETRLPFNTKDSFTVAVDIVLKGPRTLFTPERLTTTIKVKQHKEVKKNANINHAIYRFLID